jgi:hypothetical protein
MNEHPVYYDHKRRSEEVTPMNGNQLNRNKVIGQKGILLEN